MDGKEMLSLLRELAQQENWIEAYKICWSNFRDFAGTISLQEQEELALLTITCSIRGTKLQDALSAGFIKDAILSLKDPLLSLYTDEAERKNKLQKYQESTALAAQQRYYSEMDELINVMHVQYDFTLGTHRSTGTFFSYRLGYNDLYDYFINPGFSELAAATQLSYTETAHRAEAMRITGDKLLEKALSYVNQIKCESSDFPYFFNSNIAEMYFAATYFLGHSIDAADDPNTELERRKLYIALYCDLLNAILIRDGVKMPLVFEEKLRKKCLDSIHYHEEKCKKIDNAYSHPPVNPTISTTQPNQNRTGGCYVATAVYGSYDCPEVWTLRRFRDYTLAETWCGRVFIKMYYAISPTLVKWFGHTTWFKNMWKGQLDRMVANLQQNGVDSAPYEDRQWN